MPNRIENFDQPISVTTTLELPGMVIPFSTGTTAVETKHYPSHNDNTTAALCGFGNSAVNSVGYGFNNEMYVGGTTSNSVNSVYAFRVATDISMVSIKAEVLASIAISLTYNIAPYVALAIADPWSDVFKIIPETMTKIASRTNYVVNTIYPGGKDYISVSIPAGSRVAIVCGHTNDSASTSSTYSFYFSGGIAMW